MKLAIFSDPHTDINRKRSDPQFTKKLANYVSRLSVDVVLIAGDITGSTRELIKFFEQFGMNAKYQLFIPGNHDMWVNQDSVNGSWIKYLQILPQLCEEYGWIYLPQNPIQIQKTGFVGTPGWYNYSTRNPIWDGEITQTQYEAKINPADNAIWMDKVFAKFGDLNDKQIAEFFIDELRFNLHKLGIEIDEKLEEEENLTRINRVLQENNISSDLFASSNLASFDQNLENLVIATHIVPFKKFVRFKDNPRWDYFTAFLGNTDIGDLLGKIQIKGRKISVFGHTHYPQQSIVKRMEAYCVPIGYPHEWKTNDLHQVFTNRIKVLNL